MRKNIGERIKSFRKSANLKQSELAELIGVTNSAVSNWESGKNGIDVELIPDLCNALRISPNELLDTPADNKLSTAAMDFAKDFDSLSPVGKDLVRITLEFAKKHHSNSRASVSDTIVVNTVRMPVITGVMDGTIETEYAAKQEIREMNETLESECMSNK